MSSILIDWAEGHIALAEDGNLDELVVFPEDLKAITKVIRAQGSRIEELEAEKIHLESIVKPLVSMHGVMTLPELSKLKERANAQR